MRSCEDEWFIHDKIMYDIKQQLREIRQVCHDMKDAWDREVQELRSMQQLQPQPQQQLLPQLQPYAEYQHVYIKQEPF